MINQQAPQATAAPAPMPELLALLRVLGFEPSLYDHGRHIRKAKGFTHALDHVHLYPDGRIHLGISADAETVIALLTAQAAGAELQKAAAALQPPNPK